MPILDEKEFGKSFNLFMKFDGYLEKFADTVEVEVIKMISKELYVDIWGGYVHVTLNNPGVSAISSTKTYRRSFHLSVLHNGLHDRSLDKSDRYRCRVTVQELRKLADRLEKKLFYDEKKELPKNLDTSASLIVQGLRHVD